MTREILRYAQGDIAAYAFLTRSHLPTKRA